MEWNGIYQNHGRFNSRQHQTGSISKDYPFHSIPKSSHANAKISMFNPIQAQLMTLLPFQTWTEQTPFHRQYKIYSSLRPNAVATSATLHSSPQWPPRYIASIQTIAQTCTPSWIPLLRPFRKKHSRASCSIALLTTASVLMITLLSDMSKRRHTP